MNIKKAVITLVIAGTFLASLLVAYIHGRRNHAVSPEQFLEIASRHDSSGASRILAHDSNRAYLVYHKTMFGVGDYIYSTELAALPPDVRAKIASGFVLK